MAMAWGNGEYCLALYPSSSGGVLGANAMMGNDVIFDLHRRRVGFAPSLCLSDNNDDDEEATHEEDVVDASTLHALEDVVGAFVL